MTERVLVTGAAGFVGSHLCRALLDQGYDVTGVDNFDPFYDRSLKESALVPLRSEPGFRFTEADVRDYARMTEAFRDVTSAIHLAARAGVRQSVADPHVYTSINVTGTVTLLDCCRAAGVRRVVLGSSSSVYGNDTPAPFREDARCLHPVSPYAVTKRCAELHARAYADLYKLNVATVRLFTVYGPGQRPDLAIHRFTTQLYSGEPLRQFGDGSTERDYTWIGDIVQGISAALRWTSRNGSDFEIFNLGSSQTVRLDRLIELLGRAADIRPNILTLAAVPGDVRRTHADITKSQRILSYEPTVSIETGIQRFVEWYRRTRRKRQHASMPVTVPLAGVPGDDPQAGQP